MILLNRKMDYGLLLLCYLFHKRAGACAREIADHYRLSRPFVANILKELCRKGYVTSQRGVRGGYVAVPGLGTRSLASLIDSLEEPLRLAECNQPPSSDCCSLLATCPIRGPIEEVHQRLRDVLEKVTLAEVFRNHPPAEGPLPLDVSRCSAAETLGL
jgi:Rrf2 family protein